MKAIVPRDFGQLLAQHQM